MQDLINDLMTKDGIIILDKVFMQKYLEKEKEQICNAYTDGLEGPYIGAEEYYNQTYNQNK